jgi:hypothetical protein
MRGHWSQYSELWRTVQVKRLVISDRISCLVGFRKMFTKKFIEYYKRYYFVLVQVYLNSDVHLEEGIPCEEICTTQPIDQRVGLLVKTIDFVWNT